MKKINFIKKVTPLSADTFNKMQNNIEEEFSQVNSQLAENTKKMSRKEIQSKLLAQAYQKLNKKSAMTIVCQGDSLTYGQDTISADKRAAATTTTDNGVAHVQTRASITYPEALQNYLRDIYKNTTTVINKGFSGDWAEESYNHWGTNPNADLAFLMLGTNDSLLNASWTPTNVKGNIDKYLTDMRKIIDRYTDWGTAVILLTPPRLREQEEPTTTTSFNTEPFRNAIMLLGSEYGCPVIDTENFMNGCNNTYYSDGTHFNGKGYQYFASRLVSVLIGYSGISNVKLQSGDNLSVRQTRENFINNGCILSVASGSEGPEESTQGQGLMADISTNGELYYSFETLEDNLILVPIYGCVGGASCKIELDFGNEQGSIPILSSVDKTYPQGFKPLSTITTDVNSNNLNHKLFNGTISLSTTNRYIWITNKGIHNIRVTNGTNLGHVYFNGFVALSYKDFMTLGASAPTVTNKPTTYEFYTHATYSDTTDVTTSTVKVAELASKLNLDLEKTKDNFWRGDIVRVIIYNWNNSILEYTLTIGDIKNNLGFTIANSYIRKNLVASPNSAQERLLSSVSYDKTTDNLTFTWSGATTRATKISICV